MKSVELSVAFKALDKVRKPKFIFSLMGALSIITS